MKNNSAKSNFENRILRYSTVASAVLLSAGITQAQHIGVTDNVTISGSETYDISFNGVKKFTILHQGTSSALITATKTIEKFVGNSYAAALSSSNTVSSGKTWLFGYAYLAYSGAGGDFPGQGDKYIGVQFQDGGTTKYGWIKVNVPAGAPSVTIINHVYEDSGNPIHIDGVLPVELTSFSARQLGKGSQLFWKTATEVDNYGFEIARLRPENRNSAEASWKTLGFVEGHGNSNSPKSYEFIDKESLAAGEYFYRLKQIDTDGSFEYSEEVKVTVGSPEKFELKQNYPNPFNPSTVIRFSLPQDGFVKLTVYNSLGQKVKTLLSKEMTAGSFEEPFNASGLPSGLYVYRLSVDDKFTSEKKMILLK